MRRQLAPPVTDLDSGTRNFAQHLHIAIIKKLMQQQKQVQLSNWVHCVTDTLCNVFFFPLQYFAVFPSRIPLVSLLYYKQSLTHGDETGNFKKNACGISSYVTGAAKLGKLEALVSAYFSMFQMYGYVHISFRHCAPLCLGIEVGGSWFTLKKVKQCDVRNYSVSIIRHF